MIKILCRINSTAADKRLADRQRYSTFVGFSSAGQSQMAPAMKEFVKINKWSTFTLLCDTISAFGGVGTWYIITCAGFKMAFTESEPGIQVFHETFDSTSPKRTPDYEGMLKRAKKNCRGAML